MKHQELLVDVNFYQACDSLLEQAISSKEQKEPKCESRNSHPVASEKNRGSYVKKHLSSKQVLFNFIYTCLLKTFRLILLRV